MLLSCFVFDFIPYRGQQTAYGTKKFESKNRPRLENSSKFSVLKTVVKLVQSLCVWLVEGLSLEAMIETVYLTGASCDGQNPRDGPGGKSRSVTETRR